MAIDWLTVIAQIINFLVLVALLKRFLYAPVLRTIDQRQQQINAQREDAHSRKADADAERDRYQCLREDLDNQKHQLLEEARQQARDEQARLINEARKQVADQREAWQQQLADEQAALLKTLEAQTGEAVLKTANRLLADMADSSLLAQMLKQLLATLKVRSLTEHAIVDQPDATLRLVSSEPLTDTQQANLTDALQALAEPQQLLFETDPRLVCGIEMWLGDEKLSWSLRDYLADLNRQLAQIYQQQRLQPGPQQ